MSSSPTDDGLIIPEVGPWSKRKYHFLGRYLDAFTTAMKDKWGELHYIDLFSGAGLAKIRGSGEVVQGSPLIAASVKFPFAKVHLCDRDDANCDALEMRLAAQGAKSRTRVVRGDANQVIDELLAGVPQRDALCVTFADPFGLHLDFATVRKLVTRKTDLVILMADNMDALRNWNAYYYDNPNSNLDRFMGQPGWRDLLNGSPTDGAFRLRAQYRDQLKSLGFTDFAEERVQNQQDRDIYTLLYATKNPAGIKIWQGISAVDERGQRRLF